MSGVSAEERGDTRASQIARASALGWKAEVDAARLEADTLRQRLEAAEASVERVGKDYERTAGRLGTAEAQRDAAVRAPSERLVARSRLYHTYLTTHDDVAWDDCVDEPCKGDRAALAAQVRSADSAAGEAQE